MKFKAENLSVNSDLVADILYHAVVEEQARRVFEIEGDIRLNVRSTYSDSLGILTKRSERTIDTLTHAISHYTHTLQRGQHLVYHIVLGPHEVVTVDIDYGYVEITQESPNTFRQYAAKFI